MEIILIILAWIFVPMIWGAITSGSSGSSGSSIGPLECRVHGDTFGEDKLPIWKVDLKGLIPVSRATNIAATISLFDSTEKEWVPIIGAIENFQETGGFAFSSVQDIGQCLPMHGFIDWVTVGIIPKDLLMCPVSGRRELSVLVRLINTANPPRIEHGYADADHPGMVAQLVRKVHHRVKNGYAEKSEEELSIAAASIRLAVRLALADGHLDDQEGRAIHDWTKIYVESISSDDGKAKAKEFLNEAIKWAFNDGADGIAISDQVSIINRLAGKPEKYAAMELCLDVMAADGKADKKEMAMLSNLCDSLDLEMKSFQDMKDKRMINLDHASFSGDDVWGKLDIDQELAAPEKKRKLHALYMKWNSRAESLEDGDERERAQQMLDLIAEARHQMN